MTENKKAGTVVAVRGSVVDVRFDGESLPELKIRVVNVVDLLKLQSPTEHSHGLSVVGFDEIARPGPAGNPQLAMAIAVAVAVAVGGMKQWLCA